MSQTKPSPAERFAKYDRSRLERELAQAEATTRTLQRQIKKLQDQLLQTQRAYDKTVLNMQEVVRENLKLSHECERLRFNTPHFIDDIPDTFQGLSPEEISAVRKAMARLHHPDAGGSSQRMQYWNALLDQLERRRY